MKEQIIDIIGTALAQNEFRLLDTYTVNGESSSTLIIRDPKTNTDFKIQVMEMDGD